MNGNLCVKNESCANRESVFSLLGMRIDPDSIEEIIDLYENKIGPQNGAKVIAKAWTDNEYKKRLITNATSAIAELGFTGRQGENIIVVENTEKIHNIIVCTIHGI